MAHVKLRKTGFVATVLAGSALLITTWGLPAQAGPAVSGGMKLNVGEGQALEYASCMRHHGVPNFPDPKANGVFPISQSAGASPQFQNANKVCSDLVHLPGPPSPAETARLREQALLFAKCMRSHGVPGFMDPSASGGNTTSGSNSPFFQRAERACQKLAPGGSLPTPA